MSAILESVITGLLRLPVVAPAFRSLCITFSKSIRRSMQRAYRNQVRPREWSNQQLALLAHAFTGDVINVSGWRDEDKRGRKYRDYFVNANSYCVSNFSGTKGTTDGEKGIFLDLEGEIPAELRGRFQVAFNHTTLEHIYEIRKAVQNICLLSHDSIILVTPFLQAEHYEDGVFGDYWRPTPMCLAKMLGQEGFSVVYQAVNDTPWDIVYVFTMASRAPEKHAEILPPNRKMPREAGLKHFFMHQDND